MFHDKKQAIQLHFIINLSFNNWSRKIFFIEFLLIYLISTKNRIVKIINVTFEEKISYEIFYLYLERVYRWITMRQLVKLTYLE
jgi:hypothetical protein